MADYETLISNYLITIINNNLLLCSREYAHERRRSDDT